ncbi:hypothetical protein [Rheinheimera hassiensis]|uniref:hypothetical protein n=1 Tax=Rheinheimera hassiensis TaxID=1193627 RepID=UPI001F05415A|nr:hypothetical protein [Rheinheimera hassiensis]
MSNVIKLGLHKQKPDALPGCMTLDRMLTLTDVQTQVEAVLKTICADDSDPAMNALNCAEWIYANRDMLPTCLMKFDPIMVYAGRGNNEGEIVRVLQGRGSDIKELISIKYFLGMDFIRKVAIELDEAFNQGFYS